MIIIYYSILFLKVPFFNEACTAANCDVLVGYLAVYRICFGMAAFFFLFMVLNIGVSSGKDCRAGLNNGYALRTQVDHE